MNLFQAQVQLPDSDNQVNVAKATMIVATAIGKEAEQQPAAPAFTLSVIANTVLVQVMRSDGREVFARLQFDGQRFILASERLAKPAWLGNDTQAWQEVDQSTRHLTTLEVASQLGISRQTVLMLVNRHPHLRPATQLSSGGFLWSADEIAAVVAHRATHKRGRPGQVGRD